VSDELTRLDDERGSLDRRLTDVADRLEYLARHPVTVDTLLADLTRLDPVWDNLVPAEQQRIAQLLLDQVIVHVDRIEVALRADGLDSLMAELHPAEVAHGARERGNRGARLPGGRRRVAFGHQDGEVSWLTSSRSEAFGSTQRPREP
jgi:hypothetical protein